MIFASFRLIRGLVLIPAYPRKSAANRVFAGAGRPDVELKNRSREFRQ
jgi:hypothetical protein